ncbi:SDR family NAD(P)-dependent oxidoreductase [Mycolicibacterium sp. P9-22]|uniref:SDR family NAD(P)-dependent oxidoreductase n=1 Tax=Mycolicibacterium sp. P9-22 TaxID=2024613 RepID=UPI0011EF8B4C|nr:glucose 1-dehydrogenase [Mycolicibacterium sp. P9-22]KAA0109060.1 SDR family oxidoreductase [Mycolicibacterium sp. P9-22]
MVHRLTGKIAIISGGARGMGVSHIRAMVAEGARVAAFDISAGDGPALVDELGHESVLFRQGDVTSSEDWDRIVAECRDVFGTPDVLVNNAGISPLQSLAGLTQADCRRVVDINQVGTFLGMRAVLPAMMERGGSIVNIASTAGLVGFTELFPYVATKWAVRGMTKAAALELARHGIRVNTVCPGDTDTPMIRAFADAPTGALPPTADLPMGRWARPEEISSAVVFLASDESSYMSGSDLVVDGAFTAE